MSEQPKRVVVVGTGGIGTWLSHGLARALQFQSPGSQLVLVDGDTFEQKNTERQLFTHQGNKAQVLRSEIQPSVPGVYVLAKAAWIVSDKAAAVYAENPDADEETNIGKISATSVMAEGCYVFATVDNFMARKEIFDAARNFSDIDIFTGGNGDVESGDALYGSIYHYQRRGGVDITAHPAVMHDEFENPADRNPGEMSCQERSEQKGGSQLLAVNMCVASFLLAKFAHVAHGTDAEKQAAMEVSEIYIQMDEGKALASDRRTSDATVSVLV